MKKLTVLNLAFLVVALVGCGAGDTQVTDGDEFFVPRDIDSVTDDPFDSNRLSIVQIQMSPSDFESLKWEGRSLDVGLSECPSHDFEYTKFTAKVNIDGEVLENVVLRKKGYLGSLSPSKPSLKLDFDELVEGRLFKTLKRMTLNNNRQDPTHARQCLAYDLYRQNGIAAPRCSLSQVYVNGQDMGVYTHVESIKKPFLERTFENKDGNLYEAQISDFGQHLNDKFEIKTNKTLNDRSDLTAVANALDLEDDQAFLAAINNLVDIPEFITYWALDTLVGNWDSATGNANNYYVYHNPIDDLFHFIPWGLDAAFTGENILKPDNGPLYRSNRLAKRLFSIESTRQEYYTAINNLLDEHWNENSLEAEINRIANLANGPQAAYEELILFIKGSDQDEKISQRQKILTAIANDGAGQIDYTLNDEVVNCDNPGTTSVAGSFESQSAGDQGHFSFKLAEGQTVTANMLYVAASPGNPDSLIYTSDVSTLPATYGLSLVGVDISTLFAPTPTVYVLQVSLEEPSYISGDHSLHGFANSLMLFRLEEDESLTLLATGQSGSVSLSKVGDGTVSNPIMGSINATLAYFQE